MGSTVNLRCEECELSGSGLSVGVGMDRKWRFFEHRLFHCPKCRELKSAVVLRRVSALREDLSKMDAQAWSVASMGDNRFVLKPSELAELLMQAAMRPRCACGSMLCGSESFREEGTPCPKCTRVLVVVAGAPGILWD